MSGKPLTLFCFFVLVLTTCVGEADTAVSPTPLPTTNIPTQTATAVTPTPLPATATTSLTTATTMPTATAVTPTPVATATELPTATAVPLRDVEPPELVGNQTTQATEEPFYTPTPDPSFCPVNPGEILAALPVPTEAARILYLNDDLWLWREETGTAEALTSSGGVTAYQPAPDYQTIAYMQGGDLWLWRKGQTAVRLSEGVEIADFMMTSDGQVIAYQRLVTEDESELWAVRSDGSSPRLLTKPSDAETRSQYPDAVSIDLGMGWVQDSHILGYQFNVTPDGIGDPPPVPQYWVDADSGQALAVPPPRPIPQTHSGYRLEMVTTPDNNNNVQLIDSSGRIALTLISPYQYTWSFSPDDRYLIAAVLEGAVIVDLTDLSQQTIPVPFSGLGFGHGGMGLPPSWWLDNHTWLAVVPDDGDVHRLGATFTLWRVDLGAGTAVPLVNLTGSVMSAALSPDQQMMAYMDMQANMHLYNLATGQDEIYDSGAGIWFDHWLNAPGTFIYNRRRSDGTQGCLLLGQMNQPPEALSFLENGNVEWLDETRLLLTSIGQLNTGEMLVTTGTIYFQSLPDKPIFVGEIYGPVEGQRPYGAYRVYFETP